MKNYIQKGISLTLVASMVVCGLVVVEQQRLQITLTKH